VIEPLLFDNCNAKYRGGRRANLADLDGADALDSRHIAEAIQYRTLDRRYWA
jgi:predicted ATPase with chaperone activity